MNASLANDNGSVTAEFVVVLPTVIAVLGLALGALGLQVDRLRMVELATTAARAAARGEPVHNAQIFPNQGLVCAKLSWPTAFGFQLEDTECARLEGT